ncbi:MAG TPA: M24 family metallopeptidase [Planctomycetes bacterium]|jgi:Xaa-Pro aminopeptidase|nr:M24 family metallopeptidase [Planctomycetota bacterium]
MFTANRKKFFTQMQDGDVAIFAGASQVTRNNDVDFRFRQSSSFWYLTGCHEADAYLILAKGVADIAEECLFVLPKDPLQETWHGRRLGPEGAEEKLAFDNADVNDEFDGAAMEAITAAKRLWHSVGENDELDALVAECCAGLRAKSRLGDQAPQIIIDYAAVVNEMRLIKSADEISLMLAAAKISGEAHAVAMNQAAPGMREYEIEAMLHHYFRAHGSHADGWAYPSIVAGGENACILHYTENDQTLGDGDLLLIDAGAEYQGYAADITRTFPVNAKFSDAQRDVYQVVLDAQLATIENCKAGNSFHSGHDVASRVLAQGLVDLKIIDGSFEDCLEQQTYKRFTIHNTSHWLGLDVHDCGEYYIDGKSRPLEPGMVLTVEPGLYFSPSDETVPEHFRGMGIRIEDDIHVTDDGPQILSAGAPKEIDDVEQQCAG